MDPFLKHIGDIAEVAPQDFYISLEIASLFMGT